MQFWEQLQSYAIRHPGFQSTKRPVEVPEDAPPLVRDIARMSAAAGVGPMFTFQGALTQYVGQALARLMPDVNVACGGDHYVITRHRARLPVHPGAGPGTLAVVVRPELGPHGIYVAPGASSLTGGAADGLAVVAGSCIMADAAAAAAGAILSKPRSFRSALAFLQGLPEIRGAVVIQGDRIGVAGGLELAA
jgi:ApbE superfamily uncharacterized protein (UPF0280 family)